MLLYTIGLFIGNFNIYNNVENGEDKYLSSFCFIISSVALAIISDIHLFTSQFIWIFGEHK